MLTAIIKLFLHDFFWIINKTSFYILDSTLTMPFAFNGNKIHLKFGGLMFILRIFRKNLKDLVNNVLHLIFISKFNSDFVRLKLYWFI